MARYDLVKVEKFAQKKLFLPTMASTIWISRRAIIKTSQSKTFKTSVSFKANLSKIEQKVKFNPSVRQNGLKKIQIKSKSAFFMWKYLRNY